MQLVAEFLMQGTVGNVNEGLALFSEASETMYVGHTSQGGSSYAIWDKSQANPVAVTTPVDTKTHFFAVNLQIGCQRQYLYTVRRS